MPVVNVEFDVEFDVEVVRCVGTEVRCMVRAEWS